MTAALTALAAPATAGAAPVASAAKSVKKKQPVVTRVAPMELNAGDTLTIYGKNFRRGKGKNSVAFKAIGQRAIFVTADISTRKVMKVVIPERLEEVMIVRAGTIVPTKFKLRVLAKRFGKRFTNLADSPTIGASVDTPAPGEPGAPVVPEGPPPADGDCDADGVLNGADADDDGDLLNDDLETALKLNTCEVDSDGDGVQDGYEYKAAVDLNDDEYADPQDSLPYPGKRSYPNPLDGGDASTDFDGDSLTLKEEFDLWVYTGAAGLFPLSYSDGEQYSISQRRGDGQRVPTLSRVDYDKQLSFLAHAAAVGRRNVGLEDGSPWWDHDTVRNTYGLLDFNRDGIEADVVLGPPSPQPVIGLDNAYRVTEKWYFDFDNDGFLSDEERDEDADGLTNFDELHGRMLPEYWTACYGAEVPYPVSYGGTSHVDADTDGDGLRDGLDDQDHDDVPNVMELSRLAASGLWDGKGQCNPLKDLPKPPDEVHHPDRYGMVNPYNPCLPASWSRTCIRHPQFDKMPAPFADSTPTWWSLN